MILPPYQNIGFFFDTRVNVNLKHMNYCIYKNYFHDICTMKNKVTFLTRNIVLVHAENDPSKPLHVV